jgi:hypothetical protein
MAFSPEQILKKVQKLLKLANNRGATEGERDNAMRMAHGLLAKYNLDMVDVESASEKAEEMKSGEPREQHTTRFYGRPWARHICQAIAKLFFCYYLYVSHKKATMVKHYFIGRHSNAITAALIAEYVVKSIQREGNRQKRERYEGNPWLRSFCWGAAHKVSARVALLVAGEDESQEKGPGTSIVLASYYQTERHENEVMVRKLYPTLKQGRGGKGYSTGGDAYGQGKAYGSSVSLNTQVK